MALGIKRPSNTRELTVPTILAVEIHPTPTQRSGLQYQFTPKHHGGDKTASRWREELTREAEFGVFDLADMREVADERGCLYGVLRDGSGLLVYLGTWTQQIAEFPFARPGEIWH